MTEILMQQRTPVLTPSQRKFLREVIKWTGAATPRELGPQTSQEENSTRQTCKRRGWVTFDGYYWRITDEGHRVAVSQVTNGDRGSAAK